MNADDFVPPNGGRRERGVIVVNGRDSTILSLIAQNPNKRNRDVQRMINHDLTGPAQLIGKCLAGYKGKYDGEVERAAGGLRKWARSLGYIKNGKRYRSDGTRVGK